MRNLFLQFLVLIDIIYKEKIVHEFITQNIIQIFLTQISLKFEL